MSSASEFHREIRAANGSAWFDFEGLVRDLYASILPKGGVALDVGVNRGDHLLQMAQFVGEGGLVIGVEAAPAMVQLTREFLAAGGVGKLNNVVIHNVAVGEANGLATFHYVKSQPGLSSLADRDVSKAYEVETFECRVTTVDELLSDVQRRIDFAKFDIEGAEYHALKGGTRLLQKDRCPLVFEFDKQSPQYFGYRLEDLIGLFSSANYKVQDFFGYDYASPQDFEESEVWNYFAAPAEQIGRFQVRELVLSSLAKQGIRL